LVLILILILFLVLILSVLRVTIGACTSGWGFLVFPMAGMVGGR